MLFRPVKETDLPDILRLAALAGPGMTSLPYDEARLSARIHNSIESFAGRMPQAQQSFLFVLEDPLAGRVAGISAIEAAVGLNEPFYNFRIQRSVRASREIGVYKNQELLHLAYDHTGHSELCTLFLDPDYQINRNGLLLSKARLLFIAAHRHLFSSHLFAEMRGVVDEQGQSPFWDALGHHFFEIPFSEADRLTGTGMRTFIAELMPSWPIYISLLPTAAQRVIGEVHPRTAPARTILEKEGFSWRGSVDIFDAGPVLEAETDTVRAIRDSRVVTAGRAGEPLAESCVPCIVASDDFGHFRAVLVQPAADGRSLFLNEAQRRTLQVSETDRLRLVSLYPEENAL